MEDDKVYMFHFTVSIGKWLPESESDEVHRTLLPIGKSEQGHIYAYKKEDLIKSITENINNIFNRIEPSFIKELEKMKKDIALAQSFIEKE